MDRLLSREDIFPRLKRVNICITIGSQGARYMEYDRIMQYLPALRRTGKVYFWGEKRESVSRL